MRIRRTAPATANVPVVQTPAAFVTLPSYPTVTSTLTSWSDDADANKVDAREARNRAYLAEQA